MGCLVDTVVFEVSVYFRYSRPFRRHAEQRSVIDGYLYFPSPLSFLKVVRQLQQTRECACFVSDDRRVSRAPVSEVNTRSLACLLSQLNAMHLEDARLQAIRDTLITKARRVVTLKKGAVLAFMTAQFGTLGMHDNRSQARRVCCVVCPPFCGASFTLLRM